MLDLDLMLIEQDLCHVWHPCSQMKDYASFPPLVVRTASGPYIVLSDGRRIIDAISSWWCKTLGHANERLKQALIQQANAFEHVIFANTTHEAIVKLSARLAKLTANLSKVFYAGDGSSAIEIAMKMSLHVRQITGEVQKTRFIALKNGYHGETLGALSVSDLGLYRDPYRAVLYPTHFISSIPYVFNTEDALWQDCSLYWESIEKALEPHAKAATALLVEPIVQGAGGMQIYSQDLLKKLRQWTYDHHIHLIADEIMTGIGRTGKMLACMHAGIEPDFLCLAKSLTAGWMPFSAVLTHDEIYQCFYADVALGKSFLHSHTYSGHALAASIACEVLTIMDEEKLCDKANWVGALMHQEMQNIAEETAKLTNVRQIGAIVAADLVRGDHSKRMGFEVFKKAVKLGAYLRPLGDTIYWLPPLNISHEVILQLSDITRKAVLNTP